MFVKETFVALKTLNFKREDLGELESLVGSMITCLSDCGIAIGQRRPVIKDWVISLPQFDGKVLGRFSKKCPSSADPNNAKFA